MKNDNEKEGFLARTWAAAKEHVGHAALAAFGLQPQGRDGGPLSEKHKAEWDLKGAIENVQKHRDSVYVPDKGAGHKTVYTLTPAQVMASQERNMKEHPEHANPISHTGDVREGTTGKMYSRINSQETVARGYIMEDKAREMKHEGRTR